MKQQPFDGQNKILACPTNPGPSGDLPIFTDGRSCYSEWEPSPEERAEIAAGGRVCLWLFSGSNQPPVALGTRGKLENDSPNPAMPKRYGGAPERFVPVPPPHPPPPPRIREVG